MPLTIDKTVDINAPADVVWEVISDLAKYPEWNPFCVECRSTLVPGDPIDMKVRLRGRVQAQREWVKTYAEGRGFSYSIKPLPLGALSSRRAHEIHAVSGTRSRYRSHFQLQGWFSGVVLALMRGALEQGFADMTAAVQQRAEALWIHRQTNAGGG